MKNYKVLTILTVLVVAMFLWVFVRPVAVKSWCYRTTHDPRPHEDDLEWAEGKHWVDLTSLGSRLFEDIKPGWKYTNNKEKDYDECLLRNALK